MQKSSHYFAHIFTAISSRAGDPHYLRGVMILVLLCLIFSPLSTTSSSSTSRSQRFYYGTVKEFVCQGQVSIANSEDLYHVEFMPSPAGQGHGYGGVALQRKYDVTPKTRFTASAKVGQVEVNPEKKMRAKFLVHVKCSDGEIWEICFEVAIWKSYNDEDFFDGVRTYRLDASSPPIIYLGYGHEPNEYVNGNFSIQSLFEDYHIGIKPLAITEVVFEAWTNNVQAFSDGESIDAYFKVGDIGEDDS